MRGNVMYRIKFSLIISSLMFVFLSADTDITNDVYNLSNKTSDNTGNFYIENKRTYNTRPKNFTQTYANGTLIFGNKQKQVGNGNIHFGGSGWQGGLIGYIGATFKAKEVYLTGTLGAGNSFETGGGAAFTFNATENLTADTFTLNLNIAGTQNNHFKATGQTITFKNSTLNADHNGFTLDMKTTGGDMSFDNTKVSFGGMVTLNSAGNLNFTNQSSLASRGNVIDIKATNDIIFDDKSSLTVQSGGLTTDAYINFEAKNITLHNINITATQGKAQVNFKASDKLDINKLNLNFDLITAASYSNAIFEGKTINIKNSSLKTTPGASTKNANISFKAQGDITLDNVDINTHLGTSGNGGRVDFVAQNLKHTGTIVIGRDGTGTSDEFLDSGIWGAVVDFSKVSGVVSIGNLKARKGVVHLNKDFSASSLEIRRTTGNPTTDFDMPEGGSAKFGSINVEAGGGSGSGHNASLQFNKDRFMANTTLTIGTLKLGKIAGFYASNIETSNIQNLILDHNARAEFYKLNIINNGSIEMNATSSIGLSYFDVKVNQSNNSVNNYGKPILYITHAGKNLSNLTIEGNKTYRFIDAMEIKYIFTTASGNTQTFHCGDSGTQEQCDYIKNSIAIYEGAKGEPTINADGSIDYTQSRVDLAKLQAKLQAGLNNIGLRYEKVVDYSTIGIKILGNNPDNPYDINDIRYYIWQKGGKSRGDEYVAKIAAISPTTARQETITQTQNGQVVYTKYDEQKKEQVVCRDNTAGCSAHQVETSNSDIFKWLQFVSIHSRGITFTGTNIMDYDIGFFEHTATQLYNTLEQLSSTERKSSTAEATKLAADIAKIQRLVKLSRVDSYDNGIKFASLMQNKKRAHYANNSSTRSDIEDVTLDPAYLYKFSNRHTYANNIWANAIGSASFISNGYGALYGLNVGYDRFLNLGENGLILGVFAAYGYGTYTADLIKNNSHNVNSGIYSRAIIKNHEFDFNAGYTIGMNNEDINARENIWLSQLGQSYKYNTHTFNLNANYGYIFGMKGKTLVFKPSIGMSYYMINVGKINGADSLITAFDPNTTNQSFTNYTNNLGIQSPQALQHVLALNVAFETRQYFQKGSYWFINVGAQRDIYISSNNIAEVRFVGSNNLSYKQGDNLNTFANATAGGEVQFLEQFFINFGLGGKVGLSYKDINITGNLGARYVF
ncbi:vacuolating cytotoxin domain-containing protein [Helicobacter fennelliae]|uniref:vacuolating cytotoxin domain-containing protein n=2 Tax=Helicobacter fennelliae TaxID=215 RepID=UPI000E131578|nr:vacuolating cytotoxin domain-containing protein [Helicobacter fennelliae]STP06924.1 putative vacuolating cytotoxin (VacA) paralog [Helicobacter fennelliae]